MTDEQWRQLDWEDNYYSTIEKDYRPPQFDPFVELDPSISLIKEVIKQLKQNAYGYQDDIREQQRENYPTEGTEARAKKVISRIKSYEYRLKGRERTGSWAAVEHPGTISESDIRRAKEVPIESLYTGRLKKSGSNLVGLCPFHAERRPSFYIYKQDNRWTCFSVCGNSGDAPDYVMKRDNIGFIEAVKYLIN